MLKLLLTLLFVQCIIGEDEVVVPKEKQAKQFPFPAAAESYEAQQQEYLKSLLFFNPQFGFNYNGFNYNPNFPQADNRGFAVQPPVFYVPAQPDPAFAYNQQNFRPEHFANFDPNVFKNGGLPEKPIFLAGYPKPAHIPTEKPSIKNAIRKHTTKGKPMKLQTEKPEKSNPKSPPQQQQQQQPQQGQQTSKPQPQVIQPTDKFVILNEPSFYNNPYQQFFSPERYFYQPSFRPPQPHIPQDKSPGTLLKDLLPLHLQNQVVNENLVPVILRSENQVLGPQGRYSEKDLPVPIYEGNVHPGISYDYFKTDDIENDAVVIDAKYDDAIEDNDKESEVLEGVTEKAAESSVAQAGPGAIALAGVGGVASAGPRGTALAGEGGLAVSSPHATAVAGPSKDQPAAEKKTNKTKQ